MYGYTIMTYSQIKTLAQRVLVISMCLTLMNSSVSYALSPEQKKLYDAGVPAFDILVAGDSCGGENISLAGDSPAAKAFNFFIEKGLESHQAAGIVGNLLGESGLIPNRKQGSGIQTISSATEITPNTGYGIAQWTSAGRQENWKKFAIEKKMDALSLELQLLYLWNELETAADEYGLNEIKKAADLRQATWVFLVFFERPAATSGFEKNPTQPTGGSAKQALDVRVGLAQSAAESDIEASSSDTNDSSSGSGCSSGSFTGGALDGNEAQPDFNKKYNVKYNGPPSGGHKESNCTGGFTVGAKNLSKIIMDTYSPPVTSVGGYSCRQNTNDETTSIHGVGRALDIMIDGTTPKGKEIGDKIRNLMINNAENIGVQVVIWDRHIWSVNNPGWRPYNGLPHVDHLHVEINEAASKNPNLGK